MHCPVSTDKYKYILPNQYSINAFFLLSRQLSPWYLKSLLDIVAHPVIFLSGQEIVSSKIKVVWPFDLITSCSRCVSSLRVIIKLRLSQISKKKCLFRAIQLVFGKGAYLKSLFFQPRFSFIHFTLAMISSCQKFAYFISILTS